MKKVDVPKREFSVPVEEPASGRSAHSPPSSGIISIRTLPPEPMFGFILCWTGLNSISGSISIARTFRLLICILIRVRGSAIALWDVIHVPERWSQKPEIVKRSLKSWRLVNSLTSQSVQGVPRMLKTAVGLRACAVMGICKSDVESGICRTR